MRTRHVTMALWCFAATGIALAGATHPVAGQSARALVEEGNRLYQEGRFQEAHERYMEAMTDAPDSPVIPFNAGNALYQDADYQRAMEAYQQAIESGDPALASDAWYNLGNALYRQRQLEPSLEAYKQALRLNPRDTDAKYNFERVLQEMQQQQQQQQQQDQGQDDEEQDQEEPSEGAQPPQDQQQPQGAQGEEEGDEPQDQDGAGEEPQDQEGEPEEGEGESDPQEGEGEGQPQPMPGEMTEEEARRLLDAIDEDPGDVNRRPASNVGRRPSKPW